MKSLLLAFCFLFVAIAPADAQFKKLKDKLNKKLEQKAKDKAAEEAAEKSEDTEFDFTQMAAGNSDILKGKTFHYDFTVQYVVTTEDTKDPMDMTQLFSRDAPYFGMIAKPEENDKGMEEAVLVFDIDNNHFILLDEKEKRATVFEYENLEDQMAKQAEEENKKKFTITKTNETRTIANYLCTKYIYSGDDGSGEIWATTQLNYKSFDMFSYLQRMNRQNKVKENTVWNSGIEGFILHIKGVDEEGKAFDMLATDVNEKADLNFNMDEYNVMDLTKLSRGLGNFNNDK